MAAAIGILIGLLALTWELLGVISKQPKVDTYSQLFWIVRDYVKQNTGTVGVAVLGAVLAGFFAWLFVHLMFPGSV